MTQIQIRTVIDKDENSGAAQLIELSNQTRGVRAARVLIAFWVVASFCILIPFLHFVLVPGFFILGIALAYTTWSQKFEIETGEWTCPNCKTLNPLSGVSDSFPKAIRCQSCQMTVDLKLKD